MADAVESMAYAGKVPWHGKGVSLGENDVDAATMREKSGLGFTVAFARIQAIIDGVAVPLPKSQAIYRTDNKRILSERVSTSFGLVQPFESFEFMKGICNDGPYFHTAGVLNDGEKVWILLKLPNDFDVVKGDTMESYVFLSDSYAGDGKSFNVQNTPIRVVCRNTYNLALNDSDMGKGRVRLVHKQNIGSKLNVKDAREVLGVADTFYADFKSAMKHLASVKMNAADMAKFVQLVAPIPTTQNAPTVKMLPAPKTAALALPAPDESKLMDYITPQLTTKRNKILELIEVGMGNDLPKVKGTAYAALNGLVEYVDYYAGRGGSRDESLLFGQGRALKNRGFEILKEGVGV